MDIAGQVPKVVLLPESLTMEELNNIMFIAKKGIAVSGSAASDRIKPLIGSFDVSDKDDGFVFRVALLYVEKNENVKCVVQDDGAVTISGATGSVGNSSVSFKLPAHVNSSTLKHVLNDGVLEGVVKKKQA
ncbi:alpha-crystallin domain-containing protein 22.3-like [Bidens hawaiensis]|uniref:alpha-crystallin domain-containing protein 22.3-like n=1 Tax=Bidens hawaiensis TaxID=980011 RepID=UPI00404947D8